MRCSGTDFYSQHWEAEAGGESLSSVPGLSGLHTETLSLCVVSTSDVQDEIKFLILLILGVQHGWILI